MCQMTRRWGIKVEDGMDFANYLILKEIIPDDLDGPSVITNVPQHGSRRQRTQYQTQYVM